MFDTHKHWHKCVDCRDKWVCHRPGDCRINPGSLCQKCFEIIATTRPKDLDLRSLDKTFYGDYNSPMFGRTP